MKTNQLKILHITNWYPYTDNPTSALWIKRHIEALPIDCINKIYHLEIKNGRLSIHLGMNQDGSYYRIFNLPLGFWRLIELISFLNILIIIRSNRKSNIDLINFHIAYPNCTYLHLIKKWFKYPIVITEHWSGYHYNFNIPDPRKRRRIQRIYKNDTPVIAVSRALMKDIKDFSGAQFPGYVVHNIVDTNIFRYATVKDRSDSFLMISQWKWPKDPFTVLKAWQLVKDQLPNAILNIGGYGPQYEQLNEMIIELELQKHVFLIGLLNSNQIAHEMRKSKAFIHCSNYETFSVVCAEALCCGTPVIASKVGGIKEFVNKSNGILVEDNSPDSFFGSILDFEEESKYFDRKKISNDAIAKFSEKKIGKDYFSALKQVISIDV